ncbi:MAG: hypothetical protein GX803_07600 [Lentisphaerae bacterium]|jgi:hypothetical protein|nr:hypothetical protein [Lentisphaerota bacterium]
MNLWAFRFLLWYVVILLVQPQNRFMFLWPLRIAYVSVAIGAVLHILACLEENRPIIRLGPGTILALLLLFFAFLSQHIGVFQRSSAWNPYLDTIVKNSLLLIMVEATAVTFERVWTVQMVALVSTLWWIKAGVQLIRSGATYAGDRLMGAAVSLIENPNSFAYMMCVFLPLYLYAYQQGTKKWQKYGFLLCAFAAVMIIFETGSRTGMVTLIAMAFFLVPHYIGRRWKTLLVGIVAIALIYPLTSEGNKQRFRTIPESVFSFMFGKNEEDAGGPLTQDQQSAQERKAKNRDTWALIKAYPVFGVGVYPDPSQYIGDFPMARGQVHCEILMAGRQMGFIGMGLYAGLVGLTIFGGRWIQWKAKAWPAISALGWTLQMQGIATAVGGYFCPSVWFPPMMLLAGCTSALIGLLRVEEDRKRIRAVRVVREESA